MKDEQLGELTWKVIVTFILLVGLMLVFVFRIFFIIGLFLIIIIFLIRFCLLASLDINERVLSELNSILSYRQE